ncbi:1-deoxy-D-xylulose-5-phosphate synthase [Francisellaceae bacterium]|nr:1-deoxy-D-xylulose-5-phosphate synthase [Francisellaceae bacterium]
MSIDANLYPLLSKIDSPKDLKKLEKHQLVDLAVEIRAFLINTINIPGGHFASSLGALELTLALHYVYDTPNDNLVWDVGHQGYVHKILTGRKEQLESIKKPGGISGFPKRAESEYDAFGVGHSSTSISAALGMSVTSKLKGEHKKSVAIIGDGALTGGMALEALNHAGGIGADILVILNDNEMSISENVGALTNYFSKVLSGTFYSKLREGSKKILQKLPAAWDVAKAMESQAKGMLLPANLFEALGFYYVGPIDGHDTDALTVALSNLKKHNGPRLLHVITKKGKGYKKAEQDPIKFHHVSPQFHTSVDKADKKLPTFANIFGQWICDKAEKDQHLVAITPAMREGSDLIEFSKNYPERYYDVAIAEQHAVTFAAGVACEGFKPVVAIYSTFLQRGYDQFIHDVSIQNLDVTFAIDRAGLVGADGPTHAGSFDLSYLRCIPNIVIAAPSDENECYHLLEACYDHVGPSAVRYPRGSGTGIEVQAQLDIKIGKANLLRQGKDLAILCFGTTLGFAIEVSEELNATVVDMRFIKPLDTNLIDTLANSHNCLITIEENAIKGGAGSGVNEYLVSKDLLSKVKVRNLGLPDLYQDHGVPADMLSEVGISSEGIKSAYQEMLSAADKVPQQ